MLSMCLLILQQNPLWFQSCTSYTPFSFSPKWKTSFMVVLTTPLWRLAVVPSLGEKIAVTESLNCDLNGVSKWWDLWGMKLNTHNTKTMIVSRSHTILEVVQSTPLTLDGAVLKKSADLVIFGVMFDAFDLWEGPLLYFQSCSSEAWYYEKVLASIAWSVTASENFLMLFLASLGVFSAMWCSEAVSPLKLLDWLVRRAILLAISILESAMLCMLFKIKSNPMYPLSGALHLPYVPVHVIGGALVAQRH